MARGHALGPSSLECSTGATIQASAAMGSAAAAQVPRMRRREYCGRWFGSVSTGTAPCRFAASREVMAVMANPFCELVAAEVEWFDLMPN
jgi:hypothetical protein